MAELILFIIICIIFYLFFNRWVFRIDEMVKNQEKIIRMMKKDLELKGVTEDELKKIIG
ncbi:MAG: hypothetical protein J0H76_05130 [Sphingobacteriales bacterium]|nr:hypothetical protein [Sphingobacteriales bacterium]